MADKSTIDQHYAKETRAWEMLCERLGRDPQTSEESDTCTLRAAWKAMMAFSAQEAASPTLLEAAVAVSNAAAKRACWGRNHVGAMREEQNALEALRVAITLATGKDA